MEDLDHIGLRQITRYDDAGIKILFERYYTPLVLFAKSYLEDTDIARDIVQDVFLYMIQTKEKFSSIDNLKTYLYSTVKNRCLKYLRHEDVKMRYCRYMTEIDHDEEEYENKVLQEEVFALLKKAVDELPGQCRKVFMLALEGKGNAEIADLLSIGIETVKSHKKAGKKILFDRLKGSVAILFFYCNQQFFE